MLTREQGGPTIDDAHVSMTLISSYLRGMLDSIQYLRFQEHVRNCELCRHKVFAEFWRIACQEPPHRLLDGDRHETCLSLETVRAFANAQLQPEEMELARSHIEPCPNCSVSLKFCSLQKEVENVAEPKAFSGHEDVST